MNVNCNSFKLIVFSNPADDHLVPEHSNHVAFSVCIYDLHSGMIYTVKDCIDKAIM